MFRYFRHGYYNREAYMHIYLVLRVALDQWFLTLLKVLNPTSSIHGFIEPFVVGKENMCCEFFYFTFIAQNLLTAEPLGFDRNQVKNQCSRK